MTCANIISCVTTVKSVRVVGTAYIISDVSVAKIAGGVESVNIISSVTLARPVKVVGSAYIISCVAVVKTARTTKSTK